MNGRVGRKTLVYGLCFEPCLFVPLPRSQGSSFGDVFKGPPVFTVAKDVGFQCEAFKGICWHKMEYKRPMYTVM